MSAVKHRRGLDNVRLAILLVAWVAIKCRVHNPSGATLQVQTTPYFVIWTANPKMLCTTCNLQYVGETQQTFNKRMNGHRSDIDGKPDLPVSRHFSLPGHSLGECKITIIEQNSRWTKSERKAREIYWIRELDTLHPKGINVKDY